jgi:BCD family chlorophyll transporter-like MFS transporter
MWTGVGARFLPFADAASETLPLSRIMRLSLFQVSVGMAMVLMTGAINRVLIVEFNVPAWLVAIAVAMPLVFAPLRALIGHRSDHHRSALGWKRGPFIWFGSMLQFGGLAIMPFALLIVSGDGNAPAWTGQIAAALSFMLVGAGVHTTQTAGLALAADVSTDDNRPRVVALLYVMLLFGMMLSSLVFGLLLSEFTPLRLIQVIQGAAVVTIFFNTIALWKQEARRPNLSAEEDTPKFADAWRDLTAQPGAKRLLVAVGLGAAGFNMQEILLEPFGGEVLGMSVGETTRLTALLAAGTIAGFAIAARRLTRSAEPHRLASFGALIGAFAFALVIFGGAISAPLLFQIGVLFIGLGGGLFSVCTLTAAMLLAKGAPETNGLALGAWGAVQATSIGVAIGLGGVLKDGITALGASGALGPALVDKAASYGAIYHIEIVLLFATLAAIGPLARHGTPTKDGSNERFGLAAFPG